MRLPRPVRAARVLGAAVGAVALLAGCGSGSSVATHRSSAPAAAPVTASRTVLHTFTAYRADGTPTVPSARTENGYCWSSSLAASGALAFRCFGTAAGSAQILDPCFAPATAHPSSVSCVDDPWSRATTLRLTRALPAPVTGEPARPWALQLAGGARCVASTGTVPDVAGVNLSYHCSDGTAAALVSTSVAPWSAVRAAPDATALQRTTVVGAWRS